MIGEVVMLEHRLHSLRKELGLNQTELAKKIGVGRTTYAMYEQGRRSPDYDTLSDIADFYGVTLDFLIGRSENRNLTKEDEEFREKHNLDEGVKEVKFREMQEQLKDYSEEEVDELLEWMKFKAEQNRKKREKNQGE